MNFETLYHRGSSGAIYSWRVWTEDADICTEYGQIEGKKQTARKTAEAKNVDKANATTPEQQAISQAQSMWTHRIERKYRKTTEEAENDEIFLPMLAATFEDRRGQKKEGHTYPCDVQPKLDGVRCLAYWDGEELKLLSRGGKDYNVPHIVEALTPVLPHNLILDGELYVHGESLQTVTSWVKRLQPNTAKISFNMYDCVLLDNLKAQWPERYNALHAFVENLHEFLEKHESAFGADDRAVKLVDTYEAKNEDEILRIYAKVVEEGYEGAIVRMRDGSEYRFAYRSKRLLKLKSFKDDEFRVVGFTNGVGRFKECAVWICQTKQEKTFRVVSKGNTAFRQQLLRDAESYVGQWLTVKYFDLTDDGIPQFPVGIAFRLPEDM